MASPTVADAEALVRDLLGDSTVLEAFEHGLPLLADHPPAYRTALLKQYADCQAKGRLVDSEHGIDGRLCLGGVEIWNAHEFAPWEFTAPATLVMGDLEIAWSIDEREGGAAEVHGGGRLFVARDLRVSTLLIMGAEVHCCGNLVVPSRLVVAKDSYLAAGTITCGQYGAFGEVRCATVGYEQRLVAEDKALRTRPTNAEVKRALTRRRRER